MTTPFLPPPTPILPAPTDDEIRSYAYHLYQQSGCRRDRDMDNWLEATACLKANIPADRSGMRLHRHLSCPEGNDLFHPPYASNDLVS